MKSSITLPAFLASVRRRARAWKVANFSSASRNSALAAAAAAGEGAGSLRWTNSSRTFW